MYRPTYYLDKIQN